jgi:hypothetical protein
MRRAGLAAALRAGLGAGVLSPKDRCQQPAGEAEPELLQEAAPRSFGRQASGGSVEPVLHRGLSWQIGLGEGFSSV